MEASESVEHTLRALQKLHAWLFRTACFLALILPAIVFRTILTSALVLLAYAAWVAYER